jgi:hypothetical protein
MEIKDDIYRTYATTRITDVPVENVKYLVNMFLMDAAKDMGSELKKETLDRVIELIRNDFHFLPVCFVASAITKGSVGDYGAGRLIPRTVYGWLREMALEYNRQEKHEEIVARMKTDGAPMDLHRYPMGKALNQKIDWLLSGAITSEEWDRIELKQVAERIHAGLDVIPEYFLNPQIK